MMDGTCAVTSDGWTKIAAPMMVPATSAIAWGSRMTRLRPGGWDEVEIAGVSLSKISKTTSLRMTRWPKLGLQSYADRASTARCRGMALVDRQGDRYGADLSNRSVGGSEQRIGRWEPAA